MDEELRQKIIAEQDIISLYLIKHSNVCTIPWESYYKDISYNDLGKIILSDTDLQKQLSTDNLTRIISWSNKEDGNIEQLAELIMERIQKEGFFCDDIDVGGFQLAWGMLHSSMLLLGKFSKEQQDIIKSNCHQRMSKLKGTVFAKYINNGNITTYMDLANFLRYFEQGVITEDKTVFLDDILSRNKNALKYFNFGLLQDDIFKMGPEFVEYASKFPYMAAQLVTLQKNNPKILEAIAKRVQSYDVLKDNLDEIELLVTFCTKHCLDIDVEKIGENPIDELLNLALLEAKVARRIWH